MTVASDGVATRPRTPHLSVSVVICAYTLHRWAMLEAAVESVLAQTPPAAEVMVIVDHCPDLALRARAAFDGRTVQVLESDGPPGLSGARNCGTRAARGDVVAFLDDDAEATAGWLAAHVARYADDVAVLAVGGHIEPVWESGEPRWFPATFRWVVGCSYEGQPVAAAPVRNPIGANMSFRRDVLTAVGGFAVPLGRVGANPRGGEETELSIRAVRLFPDEHVMLDPDAVVRHWVPEQRSTWSYFVRRCWAEGRSKADLRRMLVSAEPLGTERSYVRDTLRRAAVAGLADAFGRRDVGPLLQSAAILVGLSVTVGGYVRGAAAAELRHLRPMLRSTRVRVSPTLASPLRARERR